MIPEQKAGCILADPPWQYEQWSDAKNGAASSAMTTMTVEDICAIPVGSFAHDDAVLAMWATWPKLTEAMRVLDAWGFSYVTGFPWVKTSPNTMSLKRIMGFWTMGASEMLLIARRGDPKLKPSRARVLGLAHQEPRILWAPGGERHSKKPMTVHEWLEQSVDGPFVELFARRRVRNWTCYGLDLGWKLTPSGVERIADVGPCD